MFVTLTKLKVLQILFGFASAASPMTCVTVDAKIETVGTNSIEVTRNLDGTVAVLVSAGKDSIAENVLGEVNLHSPMAPVLYDINGSGLMRLGICTGPTDPGVWLLAHELGHIAELLDSGWDNYHHRFQTERDQQEEEADEVAFQVMVSQGIGLKACDQFELSLKKLRRSSGLLGFLDAYVPKAFSYYQPDHVRVSKCRKAVRKTHSH